MRFDSRVADPPDVPVTILVVHHVDLELSMRLGLHQDPTPDDSTNERHHHSTLASFIRRSTATRCPALAAVHASSIAASTEGARRAKNALSRLGGNGDAVFSWTSHRSRSGSKESLMNTRKCGSAELLAAMIHHLSEKSVFPPSCLGRR